MGVLTMAEMALRALQFLFATIVTALVGSWLHTTRHTARSHHTRWIYTIVISSLAMLLSLLFFLPFSKHFFSWVWDILMAILFFISFGLLINLVGGGCQYHLLSPKGNYGRLYNGGEWCRKWRAIEAFVFLSALVWLLSSIVGFLALRSHKRDHVTTTTTTPATRRGGLFGRKAAPTATV